MLKYRCLNCHTLHLLKSDVTVKCLNCHGELWIEKNWVKRKHIVYIEDEQPIPNIPPKFIVTHCTHCDHLTISHTHQICHQCGGKLEKAPPVNTIRITKEQPI